jgi:hypothetical protein
MPTLSELQTAMNSGDPTTKAAAGKELADYYYVYSEEYNALLKTSQRAQAEFFSITHDPSGVDTSQRLKLQSLILGTKSRMKLLDERLLAFHADELAIVAPSQAQVDKIKALSAEVSKMQVKADAVGKIVGILAEMAELTGKLME